MQEIIKVVIVIIVASVHSRPINWIEAPEEYTLQVSKDIRENAFSEAIRILSDDKFLCVDTYWFFHQKYQQRYLHIYNTIYAFFIGL